MYVNSGKVTDAYLIKTPPEKGKLREKLFLGQSRAERKDDDSGTTSPTTSNIDKHEEQAIKMP